MKEYQEMRHHLITMLEELDDRLGKITDDVKQTDNLSDPDFSEQAIEVETGEVLDAFGNSARNEIEKIKQAISKIDSGTYGICLICGQPIRKERLTAMPYANLCIHCAGHKAQS